MPNVIEQALPKPTDNLCAAWERLEQARIQMFAAQSVIEARELITAMQGTPWAPTPTKPVIFYIEGIQYISYGAGILSPVNEMERQVNNWGGGQQDFTAGKGQAKTLILTTLPAKNYDRMAIVTANAWGKATTGSNVALGLAGQDDRVAYVSKFEAGSSGEGVSVSGIFRINAGETPKIKTVIYGTWGSGGTVNISPGGLQNAMTVLAVPVTMA